MVTHLRRGEVILKTNEIVHEHSGQTETKQLVLNLDNIIAAQVNQ